MSDNPFEGPRLKVSRALRHMDDLKDVLASIYRMRISEPEAIFDKKQPLTHVWTVRVPPMPDKFQLILGDVIHNLRSSLDIMMSDVIRLRGRDNTNIKFPFADNMLQLDNILRREHDKAGQDISDLIRSFKPYNGGNRLLRGLHDLDIIDKHKIIIASIPSIDVDEFTINLKDGKAFQLGDTSFMADREGLVKIFEVRGQDPGTVTYKSFGFPIVRFCPDMPFQLEPVIAIVGKLFLLVSDILEAFESVVH